MTFIDRWIFDYEFIDEDNNKLKFRLNDVIYNYETKCINFFNDIQKDTNVTFLIIELVVINFKQKSI